MEKIRGIGHEKKKGKYKDSLKSFGWGVLGLVVSYFMINGPLKLLGYVLIILSVFMFMLAVRQAFK